MTGAVTASAARPGRTGPTPENAPRSTSPRKHIMEDRTMTRRDVYALVAGRLSAILAVERTRITPRAHLAGDLHADSLDLVEAVESIEDALRRLGHDIHVSESALGNWKTVDDVVTGIVAAIRQARAGERRP